MKPTNGELQIMFDNLKATVTDNHDDVIKVLSRIETQTTKTNGRVNRLELWRSLIIGGCIVVVGFGAIFAKLYIQDIARKTAQEVLTGIDQNYQVRIEQ